MGESGCLYSSHLQYDLFFYHAVYGLKCFCISILDGIELLPPQCVNNTCETSNNCLAELKSKDGHIIQEFHCLDNIHKISFDLVCSLSEFNHVVQCCNGTDYCNEHLSPTLPLASDISPSSIDKEGTYM